MSQSDEAAATTGTRQTVVISRVFDAPRELVWKAWTEPDRLMKWWGPEHYDCPIARIDLRVGGRYILAMRGPDGVTNYSGGVYTAIVPQERYVATDGFTDAAGNRIPASQVGIPGDFPDEMRVEVTFEDLDGKTKVTVRQEGMPAEMIEMATLGWNSSLDKLAASLK